MKKGKQTRILPTRGGLNDLGKTQRTILDYGKATPIAAPTANIMQNLRNPRKGAA